jgi:hypothetical protein
MGDGSSGGQGRSVVVQAIDVEVTMLVTMVEPVVARRRSFAYGGHGGCRGSSYGALARPPKRKSNSG